MTTKKTTQRQGFKTNEFIVYPAHGVGQIVAIEEQEVAGAKLEPSSSPVDSPMSGAFYIDPKGLTY